MEAIGKLIVTRARKESVVIDLRQWGLGVVEILNTGKKGLATQLAFVAERRIPIHRREVFDQREVAANDDTVIHQEEEPCI